MSVEISITDQIVEINETSNPVEIGVTAGAIIAPVWGGITGTLSNQTDLQNALNAKFDDPTGTTAQYLRGDGSLATFPSFPVTSVFGRTGSVVATEGDYTLTQLGDVTLTSPTNGQVLKYNGTSWVNNTDTDTGLTSVGLTMPSAFSVANSPLTSNGTLAVSGAGTASQYIRGDGQLANFPDNQGGGSSVNYYLNGSVTQGTFGGVTYYEMSKTPILGAGTNFTRTNAQGNGYIASFITDAGDPSLLNIPAGNWNVEFYFQSSSLGGSPQFYGELYKVDASNNFTLLGSGSTNPEGITNGTTIDQYFTSIPVPQTSLLVTDRLAIRIFVIPAGRTITLHTENSNLCEVLTTLSTGLNALNGLTSQVQYFATGTSGTDFAISSATDTHTFNLPTASATNRGALSSADWTTFNSKQNALTNPITGTGTSGQVAYFTGATTQAGNSDLFWDNTNERLGIGTATPQQGLSIIRTENTSSGIETQNLSTGAAANSGIIVRNSASAGQLFKLSTGYTTYKTLVANDLGFYNGTSGDISLLNDVAAGKIKFLTGTASVAQMTLTANGRLLLGSTTEDTQRLQVTGDTLVNGDTITTGSYRISTTDYASSLTQSKFEIASSGLNVTDRVFDFGDGTRGWTITALQNGGNTTRLSLNARFGNALTESVRFDLHAPVTGGTIMHLPFAGTSFAPTSGSTAFNTLIFNPTINQTGGANGVTRAMLIQPTLTAAADWRSIEWSNNSGWGLYGAGTANNYMAGSLGIGSTSLTGFNLRVSKNITGGINGFAISQEGVVQTDVTASVNGFYNVLNTQAAAFTLPLYRHFIAVQGTIGAGSSITTQYGFFANSSLTGATNNYGFFGEIPSGTGRWNLYMQGSADNFINGNLQLGSVTAFASAEKLQLTGDARIKTSAIGGLILEATSGTETPNVIFLSTTNRYNIDNSSGVLRFFRENTDGSAGAVRMSLTDGGNLLIGSTTDSGEKLQVTGTAKITGNMQVGSSAPTSITGYTSFAVGNATNGGNIDLFTGATRHASWNNTATETYFGTRSNTPLIFTTNATDVGRFFANGDFRVGIAGSVKFFVDATNNSVAIGTSTINASAITQIDSTTKGFLPPRMTTAQKNAIATPPPGLMVYDTTLNKLCVFTTAWETITSI